MTNNRDKGKRYEREFAIALRPFFPEVRRNAGTQAQAGGVDLENTGCFNVEIKAGKAYQSTMIRKIISQAESEGPRQNYTLCLIKPDREKAYVMIPFDDFLEILKLMKNEGII